MIGEQIHVRASGDTAKPIGFVQFFPACTFEADGEFAAMTPQAVQNAMNGGSVKGIVEVGEQVPIRVIERSGISADNLASAIVSEPSQIVGGDGAEAGRVFHANQTGKLIERSNDERPSFPAANVKKGEVSRVDLCRFNRPSTSVGITCFIADAMCEVGTEGVRQPHNALRFHSMLFVKAVWRSVKLRKSLLRNLAETMHNAESQVANQSHIYLARRTGQQYGCGLYKC
jgi:hypothetical protein